MDPRYLNRRVELNNEAFKQFENFYGTLNPKLDVYSATKISDMKRTSTLQNTNDELSWYYYHSDNDIFWKKWKYEN